MNALKDKNSLIVLSKRTKDGLDRLLQEASKINNAGERIDFISKNFLGIAYKASTLVGDANTPEKFVVHLEGMDCMTFIEYVEAMRLSGSFPEFMENLKKVRYKQGQVAFESRNHFFTDWIDLGFVEDATSKIGGKKAVAVQKRLNLKRDGGHIIQGIPVVDRKIRYIPAKYIDSILNKLNTGDYISIYSKDDGLDVSHVGIVIKTEKQIYLRHASSAACKVVDEDFKKYISKKDGLIVLRPKV